MANEKISELVPTADFGGSDDWMLISKQISPAVFESQKIAPDNIVYDSGYKELNEFNGSFGVAAINASGLLGIPQIRVQNRKVHLVGKYILPLADGDNFPFNDATVYPTIHSEKLWEDSAGGFSYPLAGIDFLQTDSPIIPIELYPQRQGTMGDMVCGHRITDVSGAVVGSYMNNTFVSVWMTSDGKLALGSINFRESALIVPGPTANNHHLHSVVSKYSFGDRIDDYSAWRQTNGARNYTDKTDNYPLSHDASKAINLGGYEIWIDMTWDLNPIYTIEQIKAGFDSI